MPNFLRRLKTERRFLNFYFNRIDSVNGERYSISVASRDEKLQMFIMEEKRGQWSLHNPDFCQHWIVDMEKIFAQEILSHLMEGRSQKPAAIKAFA